MLIADLLVSGTVLICDFETTILYDDAFLAFLLDLVLKVVLTELCELLFAFGVIL